jgi:hypothetical protein
MSCDMWLFILGLSRNSHFPIDSSFASPVEALTFVPVRTIQNRQKEEQKAFPQFFSPRICEPRLTTFKQRKCDRIRSRETENDHSERLMERFGFNTLEMIADQLPNRSQRQDSGSIGRGRGPSNDCLVSLIRTLNRSISPHRISRKRAALDCDRWNCGILSPDRHVHRAFSQFQWTVSRE